MTAAANCNCGHSEAAHKTSTRGDACAFCACRSFRPEGGADQDPKPVELDEVERAVLTLSEHPAFAKVSVDDLRQLAQRGHRRVILRDSVLMDRGDDSDRLFFLLRGQVAVTRAARGAVPELDATLGPGDIVGEVGLLHGAKHSATVTALDDLRVLEFTPEDIRAVLKDNQGLRMAFLRMVHHRMQFLTPEAGN